MAVHTAAFMVVRRFLGVAGLGPSPDANDVEVDVLRHQLLVCVSNWPAHADTDAGKREGLTSEERNELVALRWERRRLETETRFLAGLRPTSLGRTSSQNIYPVVTEPLGSP